MVNGRGILFNIIYIYIYNIREWNATRSPKIRGFKRFFDYFMLLFPLLIIYERSKFLGDALFSDLLILSSILGCLLFVALLFF